MSGSGSSWYRTHRNDFIIRSMSCSGSSWYGRHRNDLESDDGTDYSISRDQLASMTIHQDFSALQIYGGVEGLIEKLKTNFWEGIPDDESNILERMDVFGSNMYPEKKRRSFWRFVSDACRDTTMIILMVAAVASLALGIKTEGIKTGWHDGGSVALVVIIGLIDVAVIDYKKWLQFQNSNVAKQNLLVHVKRGGRRMRVSLFDIVVGDVICLLIGDQVPADGIFLTGYCLAIDESSITGNSEIVHKDQKSPFVMSGSKVADGSGSILVTSVGKNTLMASILENKGEETPLQVTSGGTFRRFSKDQRRHVPYKLSDIRLAMGIHGTEMTKDRSDVVRWRRSFYANIQKLIQFLFAVNVVALVINVVGIISSGDVPLKPMQILVVNLMMGTLRALSLPAESPTDHQSPTFHLMDCTPVGQSQNKQPNPTKEVNVRRRKKASNKKRMI